MMTAVRFRWAGAWFALVAVLLITGCQGGPRVPLYYNAPSVEPPLGTISDPIWQAQEDNAEPSKFVVYQHEWDLNTLRLNTGGEDHVKQIAARLISGQNFPVLVERSDTTIREYTEFKYPVHPNRELDLARRAIIVQSLVAMGITDAEQRVIVSPALTPGFTEGEAERAYIRGMHNNMWGGGFGGGFGGSFGGGFGGFGGGGIGGF